MTENILMYPICLFKGHNINTEESIIKDTMLDKRDWLCKCHRCGLYVMHDGAMSGLSITMTKWSAMAIKNDFEAEFGSFIEKLKRGEAK
jgi:hypothetical protein